MFSVFKIIKLLFPYKMPRNKNNNIYIVKNDVKKKINHRIKGLKVIYGKNAKNTELILHMPLSFNKTTIEFSGQKSKVEIKSSKEISLNAFNAVLGPIPLQLINLLKISFSLKDENPTKYCSSSLTIWEM